MSYRDDHDAALARIDALSQQLDQTEAECERLRATIAQSAQPAPEPERNPEPEIELPRRPGARYALIVPLAACMLVAWIAIEHRQRSTSASDPAQKPTPTTETQLLPKRPPLPAPRPVPPLRSRTAAKAEATDDRLEVVACAARLRHAGKATDLDDLRALRASCRSEIRALLVRHAVDANAADLLTRWTELEDHLMPSLAAYNTYVLRDPSGAPRAAPAELRREFFAALRARDAILPTVQDALQ